MRERGWQRRAMAIAAIGLVFGVAAPDLAAPVGAVGARSTHRSEVQSKPASRSEVVAKPIKKKKKKKAATGLMSKLRHAVLVLALLSVVVLGLFLIGTGIRGPRAKKRRRARATPPVDRTD